MGPDGTIKEPESNVLLASIENVQYAVTVDVLHTVCDNNLSQSLAIFWILLIYFDFYRP